MSTHQVMLIGGRTHVGMLNHVDWWKPSNKTFVYDFKDETWTSGPEMSYARAGLDCTSFTDEEGINWTIVSGGLYEFNGVAGFSQTEILEENSSNWTSVAYYQWTGLHTEPNSIFFSTQQGKWLFRFLQPYS